MESLINLRPENLISGFNSRKFIYDTKFVNYLARMSTHASPSGTEPKTASETIIPVAAGDGIGPEITEAVLRILKAAEPSLRFEHVTVGLKAYESGLLAGIGQDTWDALDRHHVILKGPITTPQGGGYKSVNVTMRKTLGLYANVRPCVSYHPHVQALQPKMNLVIVRENEEDTYAGIEHRQSDEVYQCLKLITRPGCERIVRYAFDYARLHGRKRVTCMTKDNIMKLTDGLFHSVFDEIAEQYPDIQANHMIVDIGTARVASRPTDFDIIVTANLYGDIMSDVAAEVSGSVGLAGSANIGRHASMFEAVHGSAPDIADKDIANPSGLLQSAVMMLVHLSHNGAATLIQNAWLRTLEEGAHTADIYNAATSSRKVGTQAFADAVIANLGQRPTSITAVDYQSTPAHVDLPDTERTKPRQRAIKRLVGTDVFLNWDAPVRDPNLLGSLVEQCAGPEFRLALVTNRGVKVYPAGNPQTLLTDHWRCRLMLTDAHADSHAVARVLMRLGDATMDVVKTENLYEFDGVRGFSMAQGE